MIGMKRLLTVVTGLIATEALLIWLCFAAVWGVGITDSNAGVALLLGTFSVMMWVGVVWGVGRAVLVVVACVVLTYAAMVVAVLVPIPTAVICDRALPNVEISSTRAHGYFESHPVGPGGACVLLVHKSRAPRGD